VLRAFGARAEWGVSDLARELKLGKSATHRLLQSLAAGGLLGQNERRGTYARSL
jgi:DNA-binding IclR family transcriptional regulator